jgi:hypothetical protein
LVLLSLAPGIARAADSLETVRIFCRADGSGARLAQGTWPAVANLVAWQLEPAWDTVRLIAGYEVDNPRQRDGGSSVDVHYTVTADVFSRGVTRERRVETHTYMLEPNGAGGWRIRPPAPPPYVFESQADADAIQALLDPETSTYVSNSALVWQLLRGAGWEIPYADTASLARAPDFTPQRTAQVGDLAFYYDGEQPYHVGVVEADDRVISATINGGIRRTPFAAFAGEIRYRRPAAAKPPATPSPAPHPARDRPARERSPRTRRRGGSQTHPATNR